jgi:hypothetical protein
MKCEVEIDFEIPDGYKIKRIGLPRTGETFVGTISPCRLENASVDFLSRICVIVEKVPYWRPANRTEVIQLLIDPNKHKIRLKSNPTLNIEIVSFDSKARCSVGVLWDAPKQRGISHYHTDAFEILEEPS